MFYWKLLSLVLVVFLLACETSQYRQNIVIGHVELYPVTNTEYQLRIPYILDKKIDKKSSLSQFKETKSVSLWLPVMATTDGFDVPEVFVSHCPEGMDELPKTRKMRGKISLAGNQVKLALQDYSRHVGTIYAWGEFAHNGLYQIKRSTLSAKALGKHCSHLEF